MPFSASPSKAVTIPDWAKHLPVLPMTPKGRIRITRLDLEGTRLGELAKNDSAKLAYGWEGGDTIAISYEFMELAEIKREGDSVAIGPFRLRLVAVDPWSGWVLAVRQEENQQEEDR